MRTLGALVMYGSIASCAGTRPTPTTAAWTATSTPPSTPPTASPAPSSSRDSASHTPEPTADLEPLEALGAGPGDSEVLVRTDILRVHPVGARVGPVVATWPGWSQTLKAIAGDPVSDLDWIDVVGPPRGSEERLMARVSDDALVRARLAALQDGSSEPVAQHVERGVPAAAAVLDGSLRVVFHAEPRLVVATPATLGPALSRELAHARVRDPRSAANEAVRWEVIRPHDVLRVVPDDVRRLRVSVLALRDGGAEASAIGECDTADVAARVGDQLRQAVARFNWPMVRALTNHLLDSVSVTTEQATVKVRLPATRDQLEALLALVAPNVGRIAP